jgi:hypothetical protein
VMPWWERLLIACYMRLIYLGTGRRARRND